MKKIDEIVKESIPTLAVFMHAGNQDAVEVKYHVEELKSKYDGKARIERVDDSFDGELKLKYKIREYPTYILFKEGQELMRESGRKSEAELEDMIVRAL